MSKHNIVEPLTEDQIQNIASHKSMYEGYETGDSTLEYLSPVKFARAIERLIESQENSNLAATELLEELKSLRNSVVDMLANDEGQAWKEVRKAIAKADLVIARATGEKH